MKVRRGINRLVSLVTFGIIKQLHCSWLSMASLGEVRRYNCPFMLAGKFRHRVWTRQTDPESSPGEEEVSLIGALRATRFENRPW